MLRNSDSEFRRFVNLLMSHPLWTLVLGSGLISAQPESDGSESDGGEEVSGELVESRGDAPEVFEFVEVALDEIALPIEERIDGALNLAVALGRDVSLSAACGDEVDQIFPIVAAVADDGAGGGQSVEQRQGCRLV